MSLLIPRNIRHLVPVLVACLTILALPAAASANAKLKIGFLDNAYAGGDPTAFWSDIDTLDGGFMRWDLQWNTIAPKAPTNPRSPSDPAYHWGATDAFVRAAAEHGLQDNVMFTLWATPRWASSLGGGRGYTTHMPKIVAWRTFVAAAATRYSGKYTPPGASVPLPRVVFWETWNEPNAYFAFRPQKRNGRHVSPRNYVTLLNALKTEVNKAAPFKPTFVAGAMYKQGGPQSLTPIQFMQGMKTANAKFDVLSVHPYNNTPKLGLKDGQDQSKTKPKFIGIGNFKTFITLSNKIFKKKRPIWVTEFGWNTPARGKGQYVAYFKQQARFLYESVRRFKSLPQVSRMTWFLVRDMPRKPAGAWYTTGLRRVSGAKKPSFNSWIRAERVLRHRHPHH